MTYQFLKILELARDNVRKNPSIVHESTDVIISRYLEGLRKEIEEVKSEIKENNEIYLTDELSDIAWNYAVVLAICENRKLIKNAGVVMKHGFEKYSERSPAFLEADKELWKTIKQKQKEDLKERHKAIYS